MLKILLNNLETTNINFDLNQKHDFIGKSVAIKSFVDYEIKNVLNQSRISERDVEYISYKPSSNFYLRPFFNNVSNYSTLGFTDFYLTGTSTFTDESYYVFDLYDNFEDNNQILLSRNFTKMAKVLSGVQSTDLYFDVSKKIYKEFINIYVPSYFINENKVNLYLKIFFFNAIDGKFRFFQCSETDQKETRNYLNLTINNQNKTYSISGGTLLQNTPKIYKISQVVDTELENSLNDNKLRNLRLTLKPNKIITTRGKFI